MNHFIATHSAERSPNIRLRSLRGSNLILKKITSLSLVNSFFWFSLVIITTWLVPQIGKPVSTPAGGQHK